MQTINGTELLTTTDRPEWIGDSARSEDNFEDFWAEITDPDYERGELVTAHYAVTRHPCDFSNNPDDFGYANWREFIGLEVTGVNGTYYVSRLELGKAGVNCSVFDGWEGE